MALKIIRMICCGMDVHKDIIVATIGITDPSTLVTEYLQETFNSFNSDLYRLGQWLTSHFCSDVCMESTGKYWVPVYNILEEIVPLFASLSFGFSQITCNHDCSDLNRFYSTYMQSFIMVV